VCTHPNDKTISHLGQVLILNVPRSRTCSECWMRSCLVWFRPRMT
jgi:hypothetical protein